MFPIRSVVVAAVAVCGLLGPFASLLVAGSDIKMENSLGFKTSGSGEFFRAYWESVNDRNKMQGPVADHLTKEQIDSIVVLEVNMAVPGPSPKYPSLQDQLLAFLAEGNRFETGRLPEDFDRHRPMKHVVALIRTKTGAYGLVTRYPGLTVVELNGRVGVAPVKATDKAK